MEEKYEIEIGALKRVHSFYISIKLNKPWLKFY